VTTALVPLNPELGPPAPVWRGFGPGRDREAMQRAIRDLSNEAYFDGYYYVSAILDRAVVALRAARGVELAMDMLLWLERERLSASPVIDCEVIDDEAP
jgi:hypothetical protein